MHVMEMHAKDKSSSADLQRSALTSHMEVAQDDNKT